MKKTLAVVFIVIGAIAFFACSDSGIDYEKLRKEELKILNDYIDLNHPGAESTGSGLYYFNEEGTGTGDTIKPGDRVQIYYATWTLQSATGTEADSFLVDQSELYLQGGRYEPLSYVVGAGGVLSGLEEATTYMQLGTRSHLVINSELAYGQNGSGSVGSFETVLMEVEVYKVFPYDTGEPEE